MSVSFSHLYSSVYPEIDLSLFTLWKKTRTSAKKITCSDPLRFICVPTICKEDTQKEQCLEAMNSLEPEKEKQKKFVTSVPLQAEFHYYTLKVQRKQKKNWFWQQDVWTEVTTNWTYTDEGTLYAIQKNLNSDAIQTCLLKLFSRDVTELIRNYQNMEFSYVPLPFQLVAYWCDTSQKEWYGKNWKTGILARFRVQCFQKLLATYFDIFQVNNEGTSFLLNPNDFAFIKQKQTTCPIHHTLTWSVIDVLCSFTHETQEILAESWPKEMNETKSFQNVWMRKKTHKSVPLKLYWCQQDTHMI